MMLTLLSASRDKFGWVGRTASELEEERREVGVVVGIAPAFAMELETDGPPGTMDPLNRAT